MRISNLSMKQKFLLLSSLICAIFILSMWAIKLSNDRVANNFSHFYNDNFRVLRLSAEIEHTQVEITSEIRGLQVVYLLKLNDQAGEFIDRIDDKLALTPKLFNELKRYYQGDIGQINQMDRLLNNYQKAVALFKQEMESQPDNKAPYPVFKAFVDALTELNQFYGKFTELNEQSANSAKQDNEVAISQANWLFYLSAIVAICLSVLLSHLIAAKVNQGLSKLRQSANALENGELDCLSSVEGEDEVAALSSALDATIKHLNNTLQSIKQSADIVGENSLALKKSNNDIHQSVVEVSDNTTQAVTAIEELSVTSRSIAVNTSETAHASDSMMNLAQSGLNASEQTKDAVVQLSETLASAASVVNKLQTESNRIETILDVIRNISEQTNLLALNAAIEAARAGEQGRGFAVVADEVRTLAQRSHTSVNEIETMLSQLKTASENAVGMMNDSTEVAANAEQKMTESNLLISQIMDTIHQVNDQTQQIATAAEEQSAVAGDISSNMHEIQTLSDRTSQIAITTTTASNEVAAQIQDVLKKVAFFKFHRK
ncbi:methyl-accepting chemotaxis protein [Pseudoalteromonas xiamenensis]|uniref:Methyl-accepting chemotaxis protein n=2 Tax=Pseudoalteromonas xiamenensis TaxID=882626 RepID=A0A975DJQ2_9GAMM|nr:methyl-accepting chemotaxis protein [Pseudoalteromonas xiamenensis]